MYRKTVLTHFEEKRQHPATYGWTYSQVECPRAAPRAGGKHPGVD